MKKVITFIILSLLFSDCKKTEEAEPCYVGTWESEDVKNCTTNPKKMKLFLMADGKGSFTEPACGASNSFTMEFTYSYNPNTSELNMAVSKISADGTVFTSPFSRFADKFPSLITSNTATINFKCIDLQSIRSFHGYFYTKTSSDTWKRVN